MKTVQLLIIAISLAGLNVQAQEEESIDPSKPTNIYTRINNNVEYNNNNGKEEIGYRFNYNYASKNIQLSAEIPFMYNSDSKQFGLSDIRVRSFYVPYINYEKTFGGFGVSFDVFLPTGNPEHQLGSGNWSLSPGLMAGFIVNNSYSVWPILSYRYQFNSEGDAFKQQHGMTIQLMNTINLSEKIYLIATPMYLMNDFSNEYNDLAGGELEFNYMLKKNKIQVGAFTRQLANASVQSQSYRVMLRIFL